MKTEWKKVRLGELYEVHNGLSKGGKFFGSGYPFLSFSTIFNNFFIPENIKDLVQSTPEEQENYSVKAGDVFVTRTSETADELGMSCVALKNYPNATYNGFCKRLRPIDSEYKVLPKYIGYCLRTPEFRGNFLGLSGSMTTRASLKNDDLLSMTIPLPPFETQQKIAGILSAYDDLIENNRKQIKLLEEAAQKLYKEWFVKLNFPGHENVKIVDGVPEGWKKEKLENWCRVFTGKKNANQNVENGIYPFFTCAPVPLLSNDSLYEGKAVIISGNGSYTGRTQYYDGNFDLYQRTYACVRQKQEDYEYMPFIYYSMKILFEPIKMGGTKGSAIPYIVMADITNTEFLYQYDICKKFSVFAESVLDKIQILQNQIRLIQFARDRLLPRFMNGELEV